MDVGKKEPSFSAGRNTEFYLKKKKKTVLIFLKNWELSLQMILQ